ncbi:MAG: Small RNA 2'-O-methyltransferase [Marteilia pararefringens]
MADLGCSDFKLFNHLRHVPNLKNIKAVDIDTKKIDLKSLKPLAADYLCPKLHGMSLSILQGNLKFIDERLRNLDLICMIEVIEHMELCDVKEILRIIFLIYSPTYLYVTTPNRDFNKHFETLPAGEFRHPDHHYEFSSLEFSIWASEMSREFNYSYEIFGIGTLPESVDGEFCSQGALFTITDQVKRIPKNIKFEDNFVAVYNKKFPAETQYTGNETELEEEKVVLRIKDALYETSKAYYLNELDYDAAKEKLSPEGSIKIPVSYIVENMKNIAMTSEELLAAIEKYEIVEYVKKDNCIIHDVNCFFEDNSEDYVNFT